MNRGKCSIKLQTLGDNVTNRKLVQTSISINFRNLIKEAISRVNKKLKSKGHTVLPTQDYEYMKP